MTREMIESINLRCPSDQGIFVQPYGIPTHIKEPVVYSRWESGGYSGGSCWDYSDPRPYSNDAPKDRYKIIELVLTELKPNISFLGYKQVESLIRNNSETEVEYYGNSTDWEIEYIILSELEKLLDTL